MTPKEWFEEARELHLRILNLPLPKVAEKKLKKIEVWKRCTPKQFVEDIERRMRAAKEG